MKAAATLFALLIFGWLVVVTFFGPDLAKAIDRALPDEAPAKPTKTFRRSR